MTDSDIMTHLANNNYSKAMNGLYGFFPPIRRYIKANNGSVEDAKDMFQDALVILYKKVQENYVLYGTLTGYLLAVVRNLWMQELRRRNKLPQSEATEDIADEVPEAERDLSQARAAFHLLGEKCKDLLILFYFKKKSFREIATELAFSDEKVAKNQKYRCIQKAKENFITLTKTGSHGE
jgi:RNA polymerase sigma factor (sigma-70 family)